MPDPRGQAIGAASLHEVALPVPGLAHDERVLPFVVFEAFHNPERDRHNAARILKRHATPMGAQQ